jgi:hypothetical protein
MNNMEVRVMARNLLHKTLQIMGMSFLAILLVVGFTACGKGETTSQEEGVILAEGQVEFEGTVQVAVGKYMFIPELRGFDIAVVGALDSGTIEDLIGKTVKGVGEFTPERPSLLIAKHLEAKDERDNWQEIFTLSEEADLDDYFSLKKRDEFDVLEDIEYDDKSGWEGKETAKILGKIQGEADNMRIFLYDENDREVARIIVDEISDFGSFYLKKLSLFDEFWFYITVKETVPWGERRISGDIFHADVLFAGLF